MGKRYMKRTILLICICMMTLGLWGCSSTPAEQNSTVENDDTTPNINNESTVTNQELDSFGTTILVPLDVKNGYILPDGNVYFDEVSINSMDDAVALINEYNLKEEGSYTIFYVTPEYYGRIMYMEEDNLYCITKEAASYAEEYTYNEDGLVSSGRWEYSDEEDSDSESVKSTVLEHGEKDDEGRVYVDTDIVDIGDGKDISTFFDLIEEHYGEFNSNNWYQFATDENVYTVGKNVFNCYVTHIEPSNANDTYETTEYKYTETREFIGETVVSYVDGECVKMFISENGNTEESVYQDNIITKTNVVNGVKTIVTTRTTNDEIYCDYYYKSDNKEVILTYDASGTMLIRYKSINFKDGCTYDWVLDGGGYGPDHCISVTITKNGSSKTYTGKDEIPWGSPIDYPPKVAGLYE